MTSSPQDAVPPSSFALHCRICGKPMTVQAAKTDGDGKAVHEDCYSQVISKDGHGSQSTPQGTRPWNVVAAEVSKEQNPEKLTELVAELNQALDEQKIDGSPKIRPKPEGK